MIQIQLQLEIIYLMIYQKIQCVFLSTLLLAANAVGEAIGYFFGEKNSRERLGALEYERWKHVRTNEVDLAFRD